MSKQYLLDGYAETGTEGMWWIFQDTLDDDRSGIRMLSNGMHVKIYNTDGSVVFDGIIDQDEEIGYEEYRANPGFGQPTALGLWIHWTQRGWIPDDWAMLFLHDPPLLGEIILDE